MPFLAGQYAKSLIDQQLTRLDSQASMVSASDPFHATQSHPESLVSPANCSAPGLRSLTVCQKDLALCCGAPIHGAHVSDIAGVSR